MYLEGKTPKEIAEIISKKYNTHLSSVQIRDKIRRYPEYYERGNRRKISPENQNTPLDDDELIKLLEKNTCSLKHLSQSAGVSPRVLGARIEDLREQGYLIEMGNDTPRLCRVIVPQENRHQEKWNGERVLKFGALGDTHLGNKWQQITYLNNVYDIFVQEEIQMVYHVGDISDGYYKNRPGHIYELFKVGADEQSDYIVTNYPRRSGIVTKFITGNHDNTHIMNGGTNIGIRIDAQREDMVYLGMDNAKIDLTPNCILELNHPGDGSAYALSYSIQKYIDSISGGEKPNILLNGHHHKAMYLPIYRNIHSLEVGCLEAQTPWMRGKRTAAHIGAWICTVRISEDGTVHRFNAEFIAFHKPIADDY